jgi:hypothetical protein
MPFKRTAKANAAQPLSSLYMKCRQYAEIRFGIEPQED